MRRIHRLAMIPAFAAPWDFTLKGEPGSRHMTVLIALQHPFTRGTVHISSKEVTQPPAIDHAYLNNTIDIDLLIQGVKLARNIVESEPLKSSVVKEVQPGSNVTSTEALTEYFKKSLWTVFHPSGTCAMLPRGDGGVVDEKLRVYGTSNLRVVSTMRNYFLQY